MSQQNSIANGQMPAAPTERFRGLSKREHFAAQFMAACIVANDHEAPLDVLAQEAVAAADALLLELSKEVPA